MPPNVNLFTLGGCANCKLPYSGLSRFYARLTWTLDGLKHGVPIWAFMKCQEA